MEVSALKNDGVTDAFEDLLEKISDERKKLEAVVPKRSKAQVLNGIKEK